MKIPWKLKSFVFYIIDLFSIPKFLYFLQKYITRNSIININDYSRDYDFHSKVLQKHCSNGLVFEFGAGKNLAQNLILSNYVHKQIVVDLNPMIDLKLVENCRKQILNSKTLRSNKKILEIKDLENYGIYYKAPYDARYTDYNENIFDACISTNTFEHLSVQDIEKILIELYRILKIDGIISAIIDYSDHYAHTDKSISLLNYLNFSENEWKKYNHNSHFQNRLRHYEYIEIFKNHGFKLIYEDLFYKEETIETNLAKMYSKMPKSWSATSSMVMFKKIN